ncbi:MAG: hypothetical protein ACOH5I_14260 [Oligoflexus sp.]
MLLAKQIALSFILVFQIACISTKPWTGQTLPENAQSKPQTEREQLYVDYEILDWSGFGEPGFYLLGSQDEKEPVLYQLDSLLPVILDLAPHLQEDLDSMKNYSRYGRYMVYTSLGLFSLAATGHALDEKPVFYTARNLGLVTLFLSVVLEHFEWQLLGQLRYQYNEALQVRLGFSEPEDEASLPEEMPEQSFYFRKQNDRLGDIRLGFLNIRF